MYTDVKDKTTTLTKIIKTKRKQKHKNWNDFFSCSLPHSFSLFSVLTLTLESLLSESPAHSCKEKEEEKCKIFIWINK